MGRDGRPYTIGSLPPGAAEALDRRIRRWWAAAILLNAAATGVAAGAVMLAPRGVAAWAGLLPLMSLPLLLIAPLLRRRAARPPRRVHRRRPGDFPPPDPAGD